MSIVVKRKARVRKPVHFAYWGTSAGKSVCGLIGGRNGRGFVRRRDVHGKNHWDPVPCDVPYTRVTCKFENVTCEDCLVLVVHRAKKALHARLRVLGSVALRRAVRKAHGRLAVSALREVVGV